MANWVADRQPHTKTTKTHTRMLRRHNFHKLVSIYRMAWHIEYNSLVQRTHKLAISFVYQI